MEWNERHIRNILAELADENPLACRALFSISELEFTEKVPTLSVSLSDRPILRINLTFCRAHCLEENDIKAVLLHEFLHVMLGHTKKYRFVNPLLNMSLDAIINAIIHRRHGTAYSGFFQRYYIQPGLPGLLRPVFGSGIEDETPQQMSEEEAELSALHGKIYSGQICADDLNDLLQYLIRKHGDKEPQTILFIGSHDDGGPVSAENERLLDEILKKMDGTHIWRQYNRGKGDRAAEETWRQERLKAATWKKHAYRVLESCLNPDKRKREHKEEEGMILPVLNSFDKRALTRFYTCRQIPLSNTLHQKQVPGKSARIYLDVSGSMNQEIGQLIALLHHFRDTISMPLWVFSDRVYPAVFRKGKLEYKTTSGTSIGCVFEHIRKSPPGMSVIVSDGYVEAIHKGMLKGIDRKQVAVIVSANGNAEQFAKKGFRYHQLKK